MYILTRAQLTICQHKGLKCTLADFHWVLAPYSVLTPFHL